jgi:hypothetical protein
MTKKTGRNSISADKTRNSEARGKGRDRMAKFD